MSISAGGSALKGWVDEHIHELSSSVGRRRFCPLCFGFGLISSCRLMSLGGGWVWRYYYYVMSFSVAIGPLESSWKELCGKILDSLLPLQLRLILVTGLIPWTYQA